MRTRKSDSDLASGRVKCGRAVLVGLGLDNAEGHVRYTRGEAYELYGGSESAHSEMQRRAAQIREEIAGLGISLDSLTFEQYQAIQAIVERVNCE